jgi:preprotein translocase subunit SecB
MSDTSATPEQPPQQSQATMVPLRFLGQYIRDLSFEVPHAPEIFNDVRRQAPEIPASFDIAARHVIGSTFEVDMSVNLRASVGEKPAFILELVYSAMVDVDFRAVPEDQIHPVLLIEIPRHLFPFVRQVVGDMTVGGGFPPLMLQMIDFVDLYRRKFGDQPQTLPRNQA